MGENTSALVPLPHMLWGLLQASSWACPHKSEGRSVVMLSSDDILEDPSKGPSARDEMGILAHSRRQVRVAEGLGMAAEPGIGL